MGVYAPSSPNRRQTDRQLTDTENRAEIARELAAWCLLELSHAIYNFNYTHYIYKVLTLESVEKVLCALRDLQFKEELFKTYLR